MRVPLLILALATLSCEPNMPEKEKAREVSPEKVSFNDFATQEFKIGDAIPDAASSLAGTKIEITGYLYPGREVQGIRSFYLMRDRGTCCFGPQRQLTHFLEVTIPEPFEPINYTTDRVTVAGIFELKKNSPGEYIESLFTLKAESHRR